MRNFQDYNVRGHNCIIVFDAYHKMIVNKPCFIEHEYEVEVFECEVLIIIILSFHTQNSQVDESLTWAQCHNHDAGNCKSLVLGPNSVFLFIALTLVDLFKQPIFNSKQPIIYGNRIFCKSTPQCVWITSGDSGTASGNHSSAKPISTRAA